MKKILILVSEYDEEFFRDLSSYLDDAIRCNDYQLFFKENMNRDGGEFDFCIIDRAHLMDNIVRTYASKSTILYFKRHFVQFHDISELLALQNEYCASENYISAKDINQLISFMNIYEHKTIMDALPTDLQLESTSYCNAECIMCRHFYTKNDEADHLSDTLLEKLETVLRTVFLISINGYGEPFLSNSLKKQMHLYKKYDCKVSADTNLSIMNDEMITWINELFPQIEISCDGASKETFEHIRKNLNFDTFKSNMKMLRKECPNVLIRFSVVVMRQNIFELKEILELAKEYGVYLVSFAAIGTDAVLKNHKDSMYNYPAAFYSVIRELKKLGEKYGILIDTPYIEKTEYTMNPENQRRELEQIKISFEQKTEISQADAIERYHVMKHLPATEEDTSEKGIQIKFSGICDWLVQRSYIDLNGNVYPCCMNHKQKFGNLNCSTFEEIWNNHHYRTMRDLFWSGRIPHSCLGCSHIIDHKLKFLHMEDDEMGEFIRLSELYKSQREVIGE